MANEKRPTFMSIDYAQNNLHGVHVSERYNTGNCTVYFNGEKRTDCVSADEMRGYVDVAVYQSGARGAFDARVHRLFGVVQLEFAA